MLSPQGLQEHCARLTKCWHWADLCSVRQLLKETAILIIQKLCTHRRRNVCYIISSIGDTDWCCFASFSCHIFFHNHSLRSRRCWLLWHITSACDINFCIDCYSGHCQTCTNNQNTYGKISYRGSCNWLWQNVVTTSYKVLLNTT